MNSEAMSTEIIEHEGWQLVVRNGEPMVADEVIAAHVDLPLHKLRQLSARHERAGHIAPEVSTTVVETGGRPGRRRLYTEPDALFLVTRSHTPRAVEMTKVMIAVFRAVVRGLMRPDADTSVTLAELANVVRELGAVRGDVERHAAEIAEMRRELASGVIGADVAEREILAPLRRIAAILGVGTSGRRSVLRRHQNRLGNLLGFVGRGAAWAQLPRRLLEVAQRALATWLDEAIALARKSHPAQGRLPLPATTH